MLGKMETSLKRRIEFKGASFGGNLEEEGRGVRGAINLVMFSLIQYCKSAGESCGRIHSLRLHKLELLC
jgi:hypothetical protein